MAKAFVLFSLSLFFFHACTAQLELPQQRFWQGMEQGQQHRLRAKTQCRIEQLTASEPSYTYDSEAGVTEFWDSNANEFECAGIQFVRHVIQPKGLLLPYYTNAPQLVYIIKGSGIHGTVIPGCAETYESESSSSYEGGSQSKGRRSDRHQKLRRFRSGDILALPQGITHWAYNDGDTPIISVSILDVANEGNQLDLNFRKFFLAGSSREGGQSEEGGRRRQEGGSRRGREEEGERGQRMRNIFNGFDEEILSEIFNVDSEIVRKLQAKEDNRGFIVRAEKLDLVLPEWGREEQQRGERRREGGGGYNNGIEETLCSMKIRQNIGHPTRADEYNPRGGRLTSLNSQTLPILSFLRLSAERGVLYKNAIMAPHWSTNAHTAMYVTKGSARIQVVGNQGKSVFDDEVNKGQLLIIPQNFVVVKRATGDEGFEWIAFKTNDNAMNSQLAGRLSALRGMPEEVLMNSYGISRKDAKNLKYNRDEAALFSPGSRSGGGYA
ncbi:hypothetical protein ABFS83_07G047800 [Erythranthe nasuta]